MKNFIRKSITFDRLCEISREMMNADESMADDFQKDLVYVATNSIGGRYVEGLVADFVINPYFPDDGWKGYSADDLKVVEFISATSGSRLAAYPDVENPTQWVLEFEHGEGGTFYKSLFENAGEKAAI